MVQPTLGAMFGSRVLIRQRKERNVEMSRAVSKEGISYIEARPLSGHPTGVIVLLHGGGGNANDFVPLLRQITPPGVSVRYILPEAKLLKLTLFDGALLHAWYDVRYADLQRDEDFVGVRRAAAILKAFVAREEAHGVPTERIIIGGFSQGGAVSLYAALRYPRRLGGVFALSGYLPGLRRAHSEASVAGRQLSAFIGHGREDKLVSINLAQASAQALADAGCKVAFHEFPINHSVSEDELVLLRDWIAVRFNSHSESGCV